MFDLAKYIPMLQTGLADLKACLGYLYTEAKATRAADERTARTLEQEFGIVEDDAAGTFAPRRLSRLPLILEDSISDVVQLDLQELNQGRAPSRGFYMNLGDQPFTVALVGVNGATSNAHTLLPGATIPVSSFVAGMIIEPADGGTAIYQVYVQ